MRDSAILSLSIKPPHFVQSRHRHIARVGRGRRDQREVASDAADPLVDPLRVGAASRVEPRKQTARWLKGWRELGPNVFLGTATFTGVREPTSLALLGAGLAALGVI